MDQANRDQGRGRSQGHQHRVEDLLELRDAEGELTLGTGQREQEQPRRSDVDAVGPA